MDGMGLSIVVLAAILVGIIALFVVVRGLRLPNGFIERERQRAIMRRRMLELELTQKSEAKTAGEETGGSSSSQHS